MQIQNNASSSINITKIGINKDALMLVRNNPATKVKEKVSSIFVQLFFWRDTFLVAVRLKPYCINAPKNNAIDCANAIFP